MRRDKVLECQKHTWLTLPPLASRFQKSWTIVNASVKVAVLVDICADRTHIRTMTRNSTLTAHVTEMIQSMDGDDEARERLHGSLRWSCTVGCAGAVQRAALELPSELCV